MEKELKKLADYSSLTPKEVARHVNGFIKDLQDKYNNLQGIDKVVVCDMNVRFNKRRRRSMRSR